jgi:hypothetical protein
VRWQTVPAERPIPNGGEVVHVSFSEGRRKDMATYYFRNAQSSVFTVTFLFPRVDAFLGGRGRVGDTLR